MTSGVATAIITELVVSSACAADTAATNEGKDAIPEAPTIRWKVKEISETRLLMRQLRHRMPAWKLKACVEALQASPVDLAAIAEAKGVQFATVELVEVAAKCLDEITKEMAKEDTCASGVSAAAIPSLEKGKSDSPKPEEESKTVENSADEKNSCNESTDTCATAQESSSKATDTATQQQDASASQDGPAPKKESDSAKDPSKNWITRFVNAGHDLLTAYVASRHDSVHRSYASYWSEVG